MVMSAPAITIAGARHVRTNHSTKLGQQWYVQLSEYGPRLPKLPLGTDLDPKAYHDV